MTPARDPDREGLRGFVVASWSELLHLDPSAIDDGTDFFEAGGHSLTAMLFVVKIKARLGKTVPLFAVVDNPTVASFVHYLDGAGDAPQGEEARAPDGSTTQMDRLLGYNSDERREKRNRFFETYYAIAIESAAHGRFCRDVYGADFGQHGMADLTQIDRMLDSLRPMPGDVILDLGCGYGLISRYIMERTGARVVGVDLSPSAIRYANGLDPSKRNLDFHVMDIAALDFPKGTFDFIVSIDTLYYAPSLGAALDGFAQIGSPKLRLGIMRTFPLRTFTPQTWSPHRTELATLLTERFGGYDLVDFSVEENQNWKKKLSALENLRDEFEREGNRDLYDFRHEEAAYEAAIEQFRYLFTTRSNAQ